MKLQKAIMAGMAALLTGKSQRQSSSLFTFGDSYTTTGFNSSAAQPSPDNPMGNPELGQGTASDGVNWVGYLATTYNKTVTLSYNFAAYGATVNDSVVDNEPKDLVDQILHDFRGHYCPVSSLPIDSYWSPDTSLFAIWIGINDIQYSYLTNNPFGKISLVMQSYFNLVEQLYDCGARKFLIVNIPPTFRTPQMLLFEPWRRELHQKVVLEYNRQLGDAVIEWRHSHSSTSMLFYDSWSFMTKVLDNATGYGFRNNSCIGDGCLWWDGYHPSSAFHRLLAADMQEILSKDIPLGRFS